MCNDIFCDNPVRQKTHAFSNLSASELIILKKSRITRFGRKMLNQSEQISEIERDKRNTSI